MPKNLFSFCLQNQVVYPYFSHFCSWVNPLFRLGHGFNSFLYVYQRVPYTLQAYRQSNIAGQFYQEEFDLQFSMGNYHALWWISHMFLYSFPMVFPVKPCKTSHVSRPQLMFQRQANAVPLVKQKTIDLAAETLASSSNEFGSVETKHLYRIYPLVN